MDQVLLGLKDIECLVYRKHILIFSSDTREHVTRIGLVFDCIRDAEFQLNLAAPEVIYLEHKVNANGITPDEAKVETIRNFPTRRSLEEVRAFVGLAAYYRAFIYNFAAISRPLTALTGKDVCFEWTTKQQEAFDRLKAELSSDSVLTHPNFDLSFILSCDASNYAISAILGQRQNGLERPICFASRMLNEHDTNYSTTHKEFLAVIFGTKTHRFFLYGRKFQIVTD
jgi:hypothetical protein